MKKVVVMFSAVFILFVFVGLSSFSYATTTERVSVASDGTAANSASNSPSISADGRFVAFTSWADNLVPNDTNGVSDIFVHDRQTDLTERVSVSTAGVEATGSSVSPRVSADGRFVFFGSYGLGGMSGLFIHDRVSGTTELIDQYGGFGSISDDGRYVAFMSGSDNLVPNDVNGTDDIFVRDRETGTTEIVSVSSEGIQGNYQSHFPQIDGTGRFVVFRTLSDNLVPDDTNNKVDIFVRDRVAGTTERVSLTSEGLQFGDHSDYPTISSDGRFVAFVSMEVYNHADSYRDIFVHDRETGITDLASVYNDGSAFYHDCWSPTISADGRFVAFFNDGAGIYIRDRIAERTEYINMSTFTALQAVSISSDGSLVAYRSYASLTPEDTNGFDDIYVTDRVTTTITEAPYDLVNDTLTVKAVSDYGENADLELVGYGLMTWIASKSRWEITAGDVLTAPSSVTVCGFEGCKTAQ